MSVPNATSGFSNLQILPFTNAPIPVIAAMQSDYKELIPTIQQVAREIFTQLFQFYKSTYGFKSVYDFEKDNRDEIQIDRIATWYAWTGQTYQKLKTDGPPEEKIKTKQAEWNSWLKGGTDKKQLPRYYFLLGTFCDREIADWIKQKRFDVAANLLTDPENIWTKFNTGQKNSLTISVWKEGSLEIFNNEQKEYLNLIQALVQMLHKDQETQNRLTSLIDTFPEKAISYELTALIYYRQQNYTSALVSIQQALNKTNQYYTDPREQEAWERRNTLKKLIQEAQGSASTSSEQENKNEPLFSDSDFSHLFPLTENPNLRTSWLTPR